MYTFNLSNEVRGQINLCEFEAILLYTQSSKPARTTE